ncbi:MAG TPA: hypothetical protein VF045_10425 [Acidimicrobiales bacterium]
MDSTCSESTRLYGRLTARLQRDVPDPLIALGLFRNREPNELPLHLALAVTTRNVYVFGMPSSGLVEVWDRSTLRARVEERSLSWVVTVTLTDGRRFDLHAKRVGANHVNGEVVRALSGR